MKFYDISILSTCENYITENFEWCENYVLKYLLYRGKKEKGGEVAIHIVSHTLR